MVAALVLLGQRGLMNWFMGQSTGSAGTEGFHELVLLGQMELMTGTSGTEGSCTGSTGTGEMAA